MQLREIEGKLIDEFHELDDLGLITGKKEEYNEHVK